MISSAGRDGSESPAGPDDFKAAIDGDPAARWRALEACRDYLRLVVRWGRWSNDGGLPATSDLIQGTVADAWRQFSRFRGRTPGELRGWLRAILVHAALHARRRPVAVSIGSVRDAALMSSSPSRIVRDREERAALDAALGRLSERHRVVIRLRVWDRRSFRQIGGALGVSEDAARMLYGRALSSLRQSMGRGHDVE